MTQLTQLLRHSISKLKNYLRLRRRSSRARKNRSRIKLLTFWILSLLVDRDLIGKRERVPELTVNLRLHKL